MDSLGEEYARHKIRQIIREGIAHVLMSRTLEDGRINILSHSTLYGAPYSTKPYVLKNYADKKEEAFKIDLKHLFNDNVIINHDKKAQEVIAYTKDSGKQIFTIKLSSDRLISSFIKFNCLGKEKIKIPITISEKEIEKLILDKKDDIIQAGFKNIFSDFYKQNIENLSPENIKDFYDNIGLGDDVK